MTVGWVVNGNDDTFIEVVAVVAGVENEKREEVGAVVVDVEAGIAEKPNVVGAPVAVVVATVEAVGNDKREDNEPAAVFVVVVAGAPPNEKPEEA